MKEMECMACQFEECANVVCEGSYERPNAGEEKTD